MGLLDRIFGRNESAQDNGPKCMSCGKTIYSYGEIMTKQSILVQIGQSNKAREIEALQGYCCTSCGRIYCKSCLERTAPSNQMGGRACPNCRGNFEYLS